MEREREMSLSLPLSLSSKPQTAFLFSLSRPSHSVFLSLCMYVFEVCPFVLGDCEEPVLNIDCVCFRVRVRVCTC